MKIKMINSSLDKPVLVRISEEGVTSTSFAKVVETRNYLAECKAPPSDCRTDCPEIIPSDCNIMISTRRRSDCACNSNG